MEPATAPDVASAEADRRWRSVSITTIVVAYWALGTSWILVTDLIVWRNDGHDAGDHLYSVGKGVGFVTVTALLLLLALRRRQSALDAAQAREHDLRNRLEKALRLEAVGRLAGGVAHDYNNLLTVMHGHVDLLRQKALPGQEPHLDALRQAVERAVEKTTELQLVAKQHDVKVERHDLTELLGSFVRLVDGTLEQGVDLQLLAGAQEVPVDVDRHRFEQVLFNLVRNAADAMPDGGHITITLTAEGDEAIVQVADEGVGMTEEQRRHCFEPFFSTKPHGKGTGLGLSISLGIIERCGGRMDVDSTPGGGTTFIVALPFVHPI